MCIVPLQLNGDVLAAYLSANGSVEEVTQLRSTDGTTHGNYALNVCMNRGRFQAIPHTLTFKDQQMMVVVEGKRPLCWSCQQLGHWARFYPQKNPSTNNNNNNSNTKDKSISLIAKPALESGDHQSGPEEELTQITGKKKHPSITKASEAAPATGTGSSTKETATGTAPVKTTTDTTKTAGSAETIATEQPPSPAKIPKEKGKRRTQRKSSRRWKQQ